MTRVIKVRCFVKSDYHFIVFAQIGTQTFPAMDLAIQRNPDGAAGGEATVKRERRRTDAIGV